MPIIQVQATISVSLRPQIVLIPTDNHWVTAITLFSLDQESPPVECWAQIGLLGGGSTLEHKAATLAQGACGSGSDVFWSGKIIADPNTFIFANLIGTTTRQYRLVAVVNTIISTEGNLIVVDP